MIAGASRLARRAGELPRAALVRVSARPFRWAALVLVVALGATAGASLYTAHVARRQVDHRVSRDAGLAVRALDRRLLAYGEMLVAVRGLFEVDPHPSRARFAQFVASLQLDERYPGVRVLSFARAVDAGHLPSLAREVRRDATAKPGGYPPFAVHPRGRRARMMVLEYLEPVAGNERALGFDLLSDPARERTIAISQSTGRPAATAPTRLVQDPTNRKAFVFMLAVRNLAATPTRPHAGALQGVVTAAFEVDDLLAGILADRMPEDDFEVYDVGESASSAGRAPSRATAIYDRDGSLRALRRTGSPDALIPIDVGGRRWLVYFAPRGAQASTPGAGVPWIVAGAGTLASLLAAWLLLTLARGHSLAVAAAGRMTRDLERSERRTRRILDTAHDAFIAIDGHGHVTDWNPQAQALFGWTLQEAWGRELADLIVPQDEREAHRQGIARFMRTGEGALIGTLLERTACDRAGRLFPIELTISVVVTEDGRSFNAFVRDISQRRSSERLLERQRRQLAEAQKVGRFGSMEWDLIADTIEWSDELYRLYGIERGGPTITRQDVVRAVHPDDRATSLAALRAALAGGEPFCWEHRIVRPDGTVRISRGRGEVIRDDDGQPVRMLGAMQDVTELRAAEASQRHLAALVDSSEDAIIAKTLDGQIVSWNRGAQELFGYDAREAVGSPIGMLVPSRRRDELAQIMASIQRGELVEPVETIRVAKDGREIAVSLRISLIYDAGGEVIGASSIARDITRQKLAEEQLRRSSRYVEVSRDLTVTAGFDGYLKSLNPAVGQTLGWSDEEFLAQPFIERVHPDDRDATRAEIRALAGGQSSVSFVNRYQARDGSYRWFDWNAIVPPDEQLIYASGRDITDRSLMEQAVRDAEDRFRTAFDGAPIGVCLWSLDAEDPGRLLQANRALAEILGTSVQDLAGVPMSSLTHPEDHADIYARLIELVDGRSAHVEMEKRFMHRNGHPVWALISAARLPAAIGQPAVAVTHVMDISDRKRFEGQLQHLADHDALTGLFNRRRFGEELERALMRAKRYGECGAVLFLDLDGFKFVNDSLGHAAGDELIGRVSSLLASNLRETDTLARVGGDEFAVLLVPSDERSAVIVAKKLLATLRRGATVRDDRSARVSSSIGVALFSGDDELTADELLVEADIAMYDAKEAGKDRYAVYERAEGRRELMATRENWNERLRAAVQDDGFVLYAQPIVPICSTPMETFELLLRLPDDHGDLIPPGTFLYNAERFGLIEEIDRWVLRQAIGHLSASHAAGTDLMLTVNVSGKTMGDPTLGAFVAALLREHPVRSQRLVVEITETAAITNIERARALAKELRSLGCQIALDDFGAGFASFYYLKHLKFDYLKIDGEFIRNLCATPTDQLVVQAVVSIAHGLAARTIAEFVGDDATTELLRELGVDYGQGYHLGLPARLDKTLPYLIASAASA
jgi:diguanylate cyclase (GGDEF)-like protein/PAS domain S-box-containing protein